METSLPNLYERMTALRLEVMRVFDATPTKEDADILTFTTPKGVMVEVTDAGNGTYEARFAVQGYTEQNVSVLHMEHLFNILKSIYG